MKQETINNKQGGKVRGFMLPLTLLICFIILTIATGISVILAKELYFSRVSRLSQIAYYAADSGLMCATMIDDQYIDPQTGVGIFEYNNLVTSQMTLDNVNQARQARGLQPITLTSLKCATASIFDPTVSQYVVVPFNRVDSSGTTESGRTTSFTMQMDLGGGETRCAKVLVNKTSTYRQIISRGFASCSTSLVSYPIERAIISTSESVNADKGKGVGGSNVVLTSGNSWTVPAGVTTINVWAIGGGGGGGGVAGNDATAAGGGGAGGVSHRTFSVTTGQVISYAIGSPGNGGNGSSDGTSGGDTTATVGSVTLRGRGGDGGRYNNSSNANGGNANGSGGRNKKGGDGAGAQGDMGGGGGGGLVLQNGITNGCAGGTGGQANDFEGYLAVVAALGYPTTGVGIGGGCGTPINTKNGTDASGFGNGGGGAGYNGGNGGSGRYGGGGGGAAGSSSGTHTGGSGGTGVVIISVE